MIPPGFEAGCYFDPIRVDMPNHYMPHMNMRQTPMAYSPATGYLYASVVRQPGVDPPRGDAVGVRAADAAAGPAAARVHDGHRRAHRQDGLEQARRVCRMRGRRRRHRHGRRPGVPRRARRQLPGLLRENRRRRLAVPDGRRRVRRRRRSRRRAGGDVRKRRRAVRRAHDEPRGLGVQARRDPAAAAGCGSAAHHDRVGRTRRGHGRYSAGNGQHVHDCERGPEGRVGERLRRDAAARPDEGRLGGDVDQHVESRAHALRRATVHGAPVRSSPASRGR